MTADLSDLAGARVLVTGGAGFVGGAVIEALLAAGAEPVCLDLDPPRADVEHRLGSILDEGAVSSAMSGAGYAVHAAAAAALWLPDPGQYEAVNLRGAEVLFRAATRFGLCKLVHVSSYTTLIAGPRREPAAAVTEALRWSEGAMLGAYPRSKRAAELAAARAASKRAPVTMVLPSAPVGPGDHRLTPPGRLVRDVARGALPAYLRCLMNLVDVRSVADGVLAALIHGAPGERYLLAGEDWEMRDLVARIADIAGVRPPRMAAPALLALLAAQAETGLAGVTGRAPSAPLTGVRLALRRRRFSAARARAALGWRPRPVDQALADAVLWMRGAGLLEPGP